MSCHFYGFGICYCFALSLFILNSSCQGFCFDERDILRHVLRGPAWRRRKQDHHLEGRPSSASPMRRWSTTPTTSDINATVKAVAVTTEPAELNFQMPNIQLALIPVAPVVACYLFTKIVDLVINRVTVFRHHGAPLHTEPCPTTRATVHGYRSKSHLEDDSELSAFRKTIAEAEEKQAAAAQQNMNAGEVTPLVRPWYGREPQYGGSQRAKPSIHR